MRRPAPVGPALRECPGVTERIKDIESEIDRALGPLNERAAGTVSWPSS